MKKYDLYLFDFDGTLFDTLESYYQVYKGTFSKYGTNPTDEDCARYIRLSILRAFIDAGIPQDKWKEAGTLFGKLLDDPSVIEKTKVYPDTFDCINYLINNNIKWGIVTGNNYTHCTDVMKHFGYDMDRVCCVFVGEGIYKKGKPDGDPILTALEKTGFLDKKDKVLFIGDADQDMNCAINAGVDYVIIDRIEHKREISSLMEIFE